MNLYALVLIFLLGLLLFIFYLKSSLRKKISQRTWIERIETIARENHLLWSIHLPYFQTPSIVQELLALEKQFVESGATLKMSNYGGWHSESDILKYPYVKRLFRRLLPLIESYSQMLGLDSKYLTLTAWANINRSTDSNTMHSHDDALFSGCYYLQSDLKRDLNNGGITFYKKETGENILATFSPEPGDLILFPSDMLHYVHPYQGESERISIAFNIHFGDRKQSWIFSQGQNAELVQKLDPFYESIGKKNAPHYVDDSMRKSMLFHTSKIKRKIFK